VLFGGKTNKNQQTQRKQKRINKHKEIGAVDAT